MERKTNLRALRHQFNISLRELELMSGLPNQHISRAELGELSPTAQLEKKLGAALDAVIVQRHVCLSGLERRYKECQGRLLQLEEDDSDE